jgi:hypothetical protein
MTSAELKAHRKQWAKKTEIIHYLRAKHQPPLHKRGARKGHMILHSKEYEAMIAEYKSLTAAL